MSAIAQLTADILATPAAIVLFDTCAILDVARAPRSQSDAASAAMTLIALAKQTPPAIHLLAVDIVRNEWSDNIDSAEKDAESTVATYRKVAATISSLSSQPVPPEPPQLPTLPGTLRKLSLELLDACQVIDRDPTAMSAALDRVVKKKRPSHKKYVKDSYILEHCLALSSSLGGPSYSHLIFFVSSNLDDFSQDRTASVNKDLAGDFQTAGLRYAVSVDSAVAQLRNAGQIPP